MSDLKFVSEIQKVNAMKRIVSGPVLSPYKEDLQKDVLTPEEIEKVAHQFLIDLQKSIVTGNSNDPKRTPGQIGVEHKFFKGIGAWGYIVESYIDSEGRWILSVKITDDEVWQLVLDKKITGFSIGGTGVRIPMKEGE